MQLKTIILGASGYTGVELIKILNKHPYFDLVGLYVSSNSLDANKHITTLYPELLTLTNLTLLPLPTSREDLKSVALANDIVFLATDHSVSHDLVPLFVENGCKVFDLSGAFRLTDTKLYDEYYNFSHQHASLLKEAIYGLAEWNSDQIRKTNLIAVAGCYPTASLLALKPLVEENLLDDIQVPIINAVSGVSGAGRKAKIGSSFCEVSLEPYGVFNHRHQPEISLHLKREVIFTPHLGNFKRGILATITAKLKANVTETQVMAAFNKYYADKSLVRLYKTNAYPSIKAVEKTAFCDIGFKVKDQHIIIISAEDNLLKGAAAQAVQCANIRYGFEETLALI